MRDQSKNPAARAALNLSLTFSVWAALSTLSCSAQTNLALATAVGGSAVATTNTATVPRETVILSPQQAANGLWERTELFPLWAPARETVFEALTRLPACLRSITNGIPGTRFYGSTVVEIQSAMAPELCQAVGVTFEGRQCILLNCVPSGSSHSDGWKQRYLKVQDGGPGFWRVIYVPDEQRFTRLKVNGVF